MSIRDNFITPLIKTMMLYLCENFNERRVSYFLYSSSENTRFLTFLQHYFML